MIFFEANIFETNIFYMYICIKIRIIRKVLEKLDIHAFPLGKKRIHVKLDIPVHTFPLEKNRHYTFRFSKIISNASI